MQVVAFSPRGDQVAVGEISGSPQGIVLIDPATGDIHSVLAGHNAGVNALAFSPDGKTLATAGADRTIKFWNVKDGKERATLDRRSRLCSLDLFLSDRRVARIRWKRSHDQALASVG